jgi:hypothetical protein
MNDYVLNKKPEPASNDMVWAFDLGKGSIGEAGDAAMNFCTRHRCSSRRNLPKPKPPPAAAGWSAHGKMNSRHGQNNLSGRTNL